MTARVAIACAFSLAASGAASAADLQQGIALYWSGDYAETIEVLRVAQETELRDDEAIECLKYLAFSHVALGDNVSARRVFGELLTADPRHALDHALVSPKIVNEFDAARADLVEVLFQEGKASYFDENYAATRRAMNRILALEPGHALAKEYSQLASEQELLIKRTASIEEPLERSPVEEEPATDLGDRIYHQTGGITPPVLISKVDPAYPASERRAGRQGTVVMTVVIGAAGSVEDVRLVRRLSPGIDQAAVAAVKQWRYRPATKAGRAVAVYSVVNLSFQLNR